MEMRRRSIFQGIAAATSILHDEHVLALIEAVHGAHGYAVQPPPSRSRHDPN
jgi:hypothetical protein